MLAAMIVRPRARRRFPVLASAQAPSVKDRAGQFSFRVGANRSGAADARSPCKQAKQRSEVEEGHGGTHG